MKIKLKEKTITSVWNSPKCTSYHSLQSGRLLIVPCSCSLFKNPVARGTKCQIIGVCFCTRFPSAAPCSLGRLAQWVRWLMLVWESSFWIPHSTMRNEFVFLGQSEREENETLPFPYTDSSGWRKPATVAHGMVGSVLHQHPLGFFFSLLNPNWRGDNTTKQVW